MCILFHEIFRSIPIKESWEGSWEKKAAAAAAAAAKFQMFYLQGQLWSKDWFCKTYFWGAWRKEAIDMPILWIKIHIHWSFDSASSVTSWKFKQLMSTKSMSCSSAALLFPSIPFHFILVFSKNRRVEGNSNFEIAISFHFYINFQNYYFLPFWLLFPSTFLKLLFPSTFL